ncbi:tRNA glutamyl-Q(34) synthetase GluQRS [uncultured Sphaerotilus sp.]|uniref:tRNA glutamyl-Q(34) synthetase GluQRS n=1 Tax=uncultured Sphaerotilus sp. TaxID=474984 RepID=UPI0030CA374F
MSAAPGAGGYVGRFAPSPTGPLHAGSMVAALASWLDARAHGGRWLVRIEDVDTPRCIPGADLEILRQLAACGLHPDEPPVWQSRRGDLYAHALDTLHTAGLAYGCRCTRREIALALAAAGHDRSRHGELVYPGTCRPGGAQPVPWAEARAVRLLTVQPGGVDVCIDWTDDRLGPQHQNVTREVGDFVLRRADGLWAYQLAVVVDDAAQGITHVVRGEDLADNTPRQVWLQRCLGLPTPRYRHTPLVLDGQGEKLSKQTGAAAIDTRQPLAVLQAAAQALDLAVPAGIEAHQFLTEAVSRWAARCQV